MRIKKIGVCAGLLLPLVNDVKLRVVLTVYSAQPHVWQAQELKLAQETAERTWSAIDATLAQAELRAERNQTKYIFNNMSEGFGVVDAD